MASFISLRVVSSTSRPFFSGLRENNTAYHDFPWATHATASFRFPRACAIDYCGYFPALHLSGASVHQNPATDNPFVA